MCVCRLPDVKENQRLSLTALPVYCHIASIAGSQEYLETQCLCLPTYLIEAVWPWDQGHSLELKNPHQIWL